MIKIVVLKDHDNFFTIRDQLMEYFRFLRDDLPIYQPLNCEFVMSKLMDDLVMWFSSGGTKSVWHYDDYENLNCLIRGLFYLCSEKRPLICTLML